MMSRVGMLGITLCAVLSFPNAVAQVSTPLTVSVPPQVYAVGSEIQGDLYVVIPVSTSGNDIPDSSFSCTLTDPTSASTNIFSITNPAISNLGSQFVYSTIFSVPTTATGTVGTYSILCSASGDISGAVNHTFGGQGTTTFIVNSCTGDSDYTEGDVIDEGGGYNLTPWTLSATMTPANPSPTTGSASGTGITGDLETTIYYGDCDGGTNDDLPEQDATIADSSQTLDLSGSAITFNFIIANYSYTADQCDVCSAYPNNYENPQVTDPSFTTAALDESCGSH